MIEVSDNLKYLLKDKKELLKAGKIEEFIDHYVSREDLKEVKELLKQAGYDPNRLRVAESNFACGIHDLMLDHLYWEKQDTDEHVLLIRKYVHRKFRYNSDSVQLHYTIAFYFDGKEYSFLNNVIDKVENEDYAIESAVARDIVDNYLHS